ncbi:MAG TPA: hypothetical protein VFM54_06850, partial [Micromonosporaceae bacterium]|nr:hypothetical protein [Micromonosporaceae bacterium]
MTAATGQAALVLRVPAETARALADPALRVELGRHLVRAGRDRQLSRAESDARAALGWLLERLVVEDAPEGDRVPGVRLIETERLRQLGLHAAADDDRMVDGQLADMAGWWLDADLGWPWDEDEPERGTAVDCVVQAGALLAAELDRLLRSGVRPSVVSGEVLGAAPEPPAAAGVRHPCP